MAPRGLQPAQRGPGSVEQHDFLLLPAEQGVEGASSTQAEVAKMLEDDYVHIGEVAKSISIRTQ